jgi:hypothetical protein
MVMLEVCRGLREPVLLRRFSERFAMMIFLPTTTVIWGRATQLAWSLDRQGVVLPEQDLLIGCVRLARRGYRAHGRRVFSGGSRRQCD